MKTHLNQRTQKSNHQNGHASTKSVQERAYELYVQRGQEPGHELEDWLQAEREIGQQDYQEHAG